jgi:preprotein translocase subunit YajC
MHSILLTVLFAATSSSSKKSSSSAGTFLLWVVFLAFIFIAWRFFIRPRSQQAQKQRALLQELEPGDEVLTGAGIFGTVVSVQDDRVTIETAPGTYLTVLRSTIARRTSPVTDDGSDLSTDGHHDHVPGYFDDAADTDDDDADHLHDERVHDGNQLHGGDRRDGDRRDGDLREGDYVQDEAHDSEASEDSAHEHHEGEPTGTPRDADHDHQARAGDGQDHEPERRDDGGGRGTRP